MSNIRISDMDDLKRIVLRHAQNEIDLLEIIYSMDDKEAKEYYDWWSDQELAWKLHGICGLISEGAEKFIARATK